jgi:hypothetical protein
MTWKTEPMVPKGPLAPFKWVIKSLVPAGFITCLIGLPGSFKTFAAVAMACCLASGLPFCGLRTGRPRKVLYIAADDPDNPPRRAKAWVKQYRDILEKEVIEGDDLLNLRILKKAINLHSENEVTQAITALKADLHKDNDFVPEVVFIDTLFHSAVGAKFDKPEDMTPILQDRLKRLLREVGASTCVLVHHTTKDGKVEYGSVVIRATVDVIIDMLANDETSTKLFCGRMRGARAFKPIDITLTSVMVETLPDDEGIIEEEQLVVTGSAPAAKQPTKEDEDLELMGTVLTLFLGNKATYKQWFERVHEYTSKKKDGKVIKEGWSEKTFDRKLKKLKEQGRVTGGGEQGEYYSVLYTEEANRARSGVQPDADGAVLGPTVNQEKLPSQTTVTSFPLGGNDGGDGGFGDRQAPSNHRQNENDGGSRESRTDPDSVAVTDLEKEVWQNLKTEAKH